MTASRSTSHFASLQPEALAALTEHLGDGAAVARRSADGNVELAWVDRRVAQSSPAMIAALTESARSAIDEYRRLSSTAATPPGSRRATVSAEDRAFDATFAVLTAGADGLAESVSIVLCESTATRRIQAKIDAIDAAGSELLRIESANLTKLNLAERLRLLQDKIVRSVRELLHFDHFEVRLIDRRTNQLELVFAHGLAPLKIGEALYAVEKGNGICGFVAATGRSYNCREVLNDPFYHEGLPDARSSLTVPLRLHDRVIGVFNVESSKPAAFDETDQRFTELFARYIAMAMHILDLMVVERYTTHENMASSVLGEIKRPLDQISVYANSARSGAIRPWVQDDLDKIIALSQEVRRRIEAWASGPRSILGAEIADEPSPADALLRGKRVLIADNEPLMLNSLRELLTRKGCQVISCDSGIEAIAKIEAMRSGGEQFDLIITDIRMPDRNGYEVYRAAKSVRADIPVVLMTGFGYDPHHSIVRASQEGLNAFLFKPIHATQLLETLQKALGG